MLLLGFLYIERLVRPTDYVPERRHSPETAIHALFRLVVEVMHFRPQHAGQTVPNG